MLKDNIINLRNANGYSQEEVAEKVGVSRQAYAKWEKGETVPDIEKCAVLANLYGTTLDSLYQDFSEFEGIDGSDSLLPGPKGKHIFGTVTINEKGQIVIPKKAREIMGYNTGDNLIVLGDEESGLALMKSSDLMKTMFNIIKEARKKN